MIRVLYVNHGHSQVCGVHDLGVRHAAAISRAADITLAYVEATSAVDIDHAVMVHDPQVIIVNYMPGIMPFVNSSFRAHSAVRIAVIHNYQHDTINQVVNWHVQLFDYMIALDPTLPPTNKRVMVTGRPLPASVPLHRLSDRVRIGSFGFAFPHKGFPAVAQEVADTVTSGLFDLHMPEAYFNGAHGEQLFTEGIVANIQLAVERNPGVEVNITDGFLSEEAIVQRLARNHVNCLFYVPGQPNAGLSSALDYLVAARRPILVTDCAMFQHYADWISFFPRTRLRDILEDYAPYAEQAESLYDWASNEVTEQTAAHLRRVV